MAGFPYIDEASSRPGRKIQRQDRGPSCIGIQLYCFDDAREFATSQIRYPLANATGTETRTVPNRAKPVPGFLD